MCACACVCGTTQVDYRALHKVLRGLKAHAQNELPDLLGNLGRFQQQRATLHSARQPAEAVLSAFDILRPQLVALMGKARAGDRDAGDLLTAVSVALHKVHSNGWQQCKHVCAIL